MPINSSNMGLPIPVPSVDSGPAWAQSLQSCLTILDGHTHAPGSGVPITPAAININADLTYNSFNLTNVRTTRFSNQLSSFTPAVTDLGCLLEVNNELYYIDGVGNVVPITSNGSVTGSTGTITGLPSGTAGAAYSAGTFIFTSATSTSANLDGGSLILRNNTASSKGLTLAPPNAMASDYTITLPALPGTARVLSIDTSGVVSAGAAGVIVTADIGAQQVTATQIANGTIGAAQITNGSITAAQIASGTITTTQINTNTLTSGFYIPTVVTSTGCTVTAAGCNYSRTGGTATISGRIRITVLGGTWSCTISVPFASNNFINGDQAAGCGVAPSSASVLAIQSETGTANLVLYNINGPGVATDYFFTVLYQIP